MTDRGHTRSRTAPEVLPAVVAIRRRPAMYLGVDDPAAVPRALLELLVRDALRERSVGGALEISIEIALDGRLDCVDDGPGLPVTRLAPGRRPQLTEMLSGLVAGAAPRGYGLAVVSAFCRVVDASVSRDGRLYTQRFGTTGDSDEDIVEQTTLTDLGPTDAHGTTLSWSLREEWVDGATWPADADAIVHAVAVEQAAGGTSVNVIDLR